MIEAVGHAQIPTLLGAFGRLLEPDGLLGLQAITIADQHYARACRQVDFDKRHIFSGSVIPSVTAITTAATRASDLRLLHLEDFGPHYARTLAAWRRNLGDRRGEARGLGYDESFLRLWDFYLAYCEGGFAERFLGLAQMVFARPGARPEPILCPSVRR